MLNVIMLSVAIFHCYAECRYAECHYGECRYAECRVSSVAYYPYENYYCCNKFYSTDTAGINYIP
jgi:hypothetical protein